MHNNIYKKHFPIRTEFTLFSEQEKKQLCRWAAMFPTDIEIEIIRKCKDAGRMGLLPTYNLNDYSIDMITKNYFDEEGIIYINLILYAYQYNFLLSFYFFPMLTREKYKYYLSKNTDGLNKAFLRD